MLRPHPEVALKNAMDIDNNGDDEMLAVSPCPLDDGEACDYDLDDEYGAS